MLLPNLQENLRTACLESATADHALGAAIANNEPDEVYAHCFEWSKRAHAAHEEAQQAEREEWHRNH